MRLTYTAEVRVDRPEQVEELVRLAANAEIGLTVFEPESQEPEPERFTFDRRKAVEDLETLANSISVVSPYSDADEYHGLIDAAIANDVITRRHPNSYILIYPMSLSQPDPIVAVDVAGRPTLLGLTSTPTEREGETPVEFTLRFLEEVVEEANGLLAE